MKIYYKRSNTSCIFRPLLGEDGHKNGRNMHEVLLRLL
jgi:hypothetical protein